MRTFFQSTDLFNDAATMAGRDPLATTGGIVESPHRKPPPSRQMERRDAKEYRERCGPWLPHNADAEPVPHPKQ
jgi:hypothetical protein